MRERRVANVVTAHVLTLVSLCIVALGAQVHPAPHAGGGGTPGILLASPEPARWSVFGFGMPEARAVFSPQRLWEDSRPLVITLAAVGILESLLIGWLLVERRRRYRAEGEVGQRLQEMRAQLATITHLDRRAAMGEVTAAITHELNQPLEAILHNAEAGELMLESGVSSPEELRIIFADIRRIDTRAAEIIQRLRGLLGRKELETRPLDINELTRDTAALVTPVASAKGVRIALDLATTLDPVVGDRVHLQQVLLNVLLNGIEAMSTTARERRRLLVRTVTTDQQIEISVHDQGLGIRAASVSQIFEPFYTTKGEGMGIGLSISRTIVAAHGGLIAARNNADGGATVWFTLPVCRAAGALPARETATPRLAPSPPVRREHADRSPLDEIRRHWGLALHASRAILTRCAMFVNRGFLFTLSDTAHHGRRRHEIP